jgi:hypothetical protein
MDALRLMRVVGDSEIGRKRHIEGSVLLTYPESDKNFSGYDETEEPSRVPLSLTP